MRLRSAITLMLALSGTACLEQLATPADCPDLCPGTSLVVKDTVLDVLPEQDSTYIGYLQADRVGAVLVSNGIEAGDARGFAVFTDRPDSVLAGGGQLQPYTIDSVAVILNLVARDTAVRGLRFIVHRLPSSIDTNSTFAEIDGSLTPETLIDSVAVHDTLRSGQVRMLLTGEAIARLAPVEGDSLMAIGIRLNADSPTGARLGAVSGAAGPPVITTFVRVLNVTDTTLLHQTITTGSARANYVLGGLAPPEPGALFLGGRGGSRLLLRFAVPQRLKDSAAVIRATLELTPSGPLKGLRNDPAELQIRGVLVDLGAKSPPISSPVSASLIGSGVSTVQSIDIRSVVNTWFGGSGVTPTLLLGLAPEGGTFARPEFLSTQSGTGQPRLRLTYALPSRPGHP